MRAKLVKESLIDSQHPKVITAKERYKRMESRMKEEIIEPGLYTITESDQGGMRDYTKGVIKVTETMNLWDLALQVAEKLEYVSPWPYLKIHKFNKWDHEELKKGEKVIDGVFPDKQLTIEF